MVIRPDGKVSLCCNDALGQMTLGDVNEKSLQEIWFSNEYSLIREKTVKGRNNIELCSICDHVHREIY